VTTYHRLLRVSIHSTIAANYMAFEDPRLFCGSIRDKREKVIQHWQQIAALEHFIVRQPQRRRDLPRAVHLQQESRLPWSLEDTQSYGQGCLLHRKRPQSPGIYVIKTYLFVSDGRGNWAFVFVFSGLSKARSSLDNISAWVTNIRLDYQILPWITALACKQGSLQFTS